MLTRWAAVRCCAAVSPLHQPSPPVGERSNAKRRNNASDGWADTAPFPAETQSSSSRRLVHPPHGHDPGPQLKGRTSGTAFGASIWANRSPFCGDKSPILETGRHQRSRRRTIWNRRAKKMSNHIFATNLSWPAPLQSSPAAATTVPKDVRSSYWFSANSRGSKASVASARSRLGGWRGLVCWHRRSLTLCLANRNKVASVASATVSTRGDSADSLLGRSLVMSSPISREKSPHMMVWAVT